MEKNIKDYLHLYLGCEVEAEFPKGKWICKFVGFFDHEYEVVTVVRDGGITKHQIDEVKPILRPLSDMTEEEINYWFNDFSNSHHGNSKYTLDEAVWTTELNGNPCDPHWTLWCKEKEMGCRHGYVIDIQHHVNPAEFIWLLSKHFDLFGLIDAGLAIDKTNHIYEY